MVVKSSPGRQPLKSSDTNRLKEGQYRPLKSKAIKGNSTKMKNLLGPSLSPSKTPLTSSSLANINKSSPIKHQSIVPQTPEKPHQTPTKQSSLLFKLSTPFKFTSSPSKIGENAFISTLSTPSSESPSSSHSGSPNSSIKLEDGYPGSPGNKTYATNSVTESGSINEGSNSVGSCRKRITTHNSLDNHQGPPVSRRNARERNRVKQVSLGFAMLRQHVPHANRKKKLSKVETLRCAVEYIKNLQSLLQENPLPLHATTDSLQQKISTPKFPSDPSSEQFIQIQLNAQTEVNTHFNLQKMSQLSSSFQQNVQTNQYYEDKLQLQQMPNSSCLEAQVLKVPKVEGNFQTPVYSTSIFSIPSVSYVKTFPSPFSTSPTGSLDEVSPLQENKDTFPSMAPEVSDYNQGFPPKEVGDVDLMEALAWWQQNS